ncbi:DHA2 family multidrug resistance protein-like MFS transporter [Lipingzhangella halophila]|uniref:DHA2 family multidrug resistance protein-like MFS transporter n=1 Tax=Lipingzhangella halophila TaxID=1783352 RepID=A0A7W7RD25_9ACTN|nr:MFS transporter [Lipingzhangella halophila]MBB4929555.1 DHA2 family multidrug resistance protein-like MFS transporter [Lipingzhangella halophila]
MTERTPPRATTREWLGLAVLTLPTLLIAINTTVLVLAAPKVTADLGASAAQQLWITDIYAFLIAGFLITMGRLGDRIGRRRLLLLGAAAFILASVLAAYSTTSEMLIATRALMGIAGATLMPSTLALLRVMFPDPRQRTAAIAVWMTSISAGTALGPLLGGVLLRYFWWGSTLLMGVPVLALLLLVGPFLLPEYRDPRAGPLDLRSVALSLVSMLAVIYGFKHTAEHGPTATATIVMLAGLAVGAVFLRRQRRLPEPLLDLRMFGNRAFSVALVVVTLLLVVFAGNQFLFSLYLQHVVGLSPLWAGVWMVPSATALLVGSMLAPLIVRWVRPAFVVGVGLLVGAAGFALLTQVAGPASGIGSAPFLLAQFGLALAFFGLGPPSVLGADLVVGAAPPEKAGSASATEETAAELGIALGIAILGSIGAAVYRARMGGATDSGMPPEVAGPVRDSIDGAMSVADRLDPATLDAARAAFADGFALSGGISALAMAVLGVAGMVLLRHVRGASEHELPEEPPEPGLDDAPVGVR